MSQLLYIFTDFGLQLCQEGYAGANGFGGRLPFGIRSGQIDVDEIILKGRFWW